MPLPSLVTPEWLLAQLDAADLRVIDASAHLPATARDAAAEFAHSHIKGAVFLDLADLIDAAAPIENTLPGADQFAAAMAALGIGNDCRVVLYDDSDIKTAARAWFLLRLHGVRDVAILDGGFSAWKAQGRPVERGESCPVPATFAASSGPGALRDKAAVLANITSGGEQLIDARGAPRFTGEEAETRPGIASGHIPGSVNLPYKALFNETGKWKQGPALAQAFTAAGIDIDRPVIASCGSGMTACVVLFGLHLLGKHDAALYDGSWTEWGADPDTPKSSGAA